VHFSAEGYDKIARQVASAIEAAIDVEAGDR
jgi:lysophospholipase L1-like esterase